MNFNNICVFDFETGGVNPEKCEVLSLAACVLDGRTLKAFDDGFFYSLIKPHKEENVEEGALRVNKLTLEELRVAPSLSTVWPNFVSFVNRFNPTPGKWFKAPIPCGFNIRNFDIPIIERLCTLFGNVDKNGEQNIFARQAMLDVRDMLWWWFENNKDLTKMTLDAIREYVGIDGSQAHNAEVDVKHTANLAVRFLKFHRNIASKTSFAGAFKE